MPSARRPVRVASVTTASVTRVPKRPSTVHGTLTGRPPPCPGSGEPGATNRLTGLWDATAGRVPATVLTGQIEHRCSGPGASRRWTWRRPTATCRPSGRPWCPTPLRRTGRMRLQDGDPRTELLAAHLPGRDRDPPDGRGRPARLSRTARWSRDRPTGGLGDGCCEAARGGRTAGDRRRPRSSNHADAVRAVAERFDCPVITTLT